jgi:hypothetical protein
MITLPPEGLPRLETIGTILLVENMTTIDVDLHLQTGTGTLHHHQITGDAILLHPILATAVMEVLRLHRLLHLMIDMIEEVIATETIPRRSHLQGLVLLRLVVGTIMIGCLRGKLPDARLLTQAKTGYYLGTILTIVADHRLLRDIMIIIGHPILRRDLGTLMFLFLLWTIWGFNVRLMTGVALKVLVLVHTIILPTAMVVLDPALA